MAPPPLRFCRASLLVRLELSFCMMRSTAILPAVFLGQVQIKQDQIRARSFGVLTLTIQKVHCFCPIHP